MTSRLRQAGASLCELVGEKRVRNLRRDPGTVARPAIGVHGSAVGQARQSLKRERQDLGARAPRPIRHEADPAGVVLENRIVEAGRFARVFPLGFLPLIHDAPSLRRAWSGWRP